MGEDEARLWSALASCQMLVGIQSAAWDSFDHAIELYRERGGWHEFALAVLRMFEVVLPVGIGPRRPLVDEALAGLGNEETAEVCRLLAIRCQFDMVRSPETLMPNARLPLPGSWVLVRANYR